MQYNTIPSQPRQQDTAPLGMPDLATLFGVRIGKDTTGNFVLTPAGLAVRGRDGRYFGFEQSGRPSRLLDVTSLVLPIDPGVYRIPAQKVYPGDLIVTSDSPFTALFVVETDEDGDRIIGLDATCNELIEYVPPDNLFADVLFVGSIRLFVRIVSVFDLLKELTDDLGI